MFIGNREFDLENEAYIMGILNVTPDSFSDGGKWNELDKTLAHVEEMINDGAAIIDIGGESTRPGYIKVSVEEEIMRVAPVIEKIKERFDIPVSVDTYKAAVAEAALKAGADMLNDIWGFKGDADMAAVAAKYDVPCCLMHNRDTAVRPYTDFIEDVINDLKESINIGLSAGVKKDKMITDPGIGFGKTLDENLIMMKKLEQLKRLECPVLLGTSRKSMIGLTLDLPVDERLEGTIATTVLGIMKGCSIIRVHDVRENYRALKMTKAICNCSEPD